MPSVKINPIRIYGPWVDGFTLDRHSIGVYSRWNPDRTELGELIHQLKYSKNAAALARIVDTAEEFIRKRWGELPALDCIVPAPPSLARFSTQPVFEIVDALAARLGIDSPHDAVIKVSETPALKRISFGVDRRLLLRAAIQKGPRDIRNKCILVVDDFTETHSTLGRATDVLLNDGGPSEVYALAFLRTR